MRIPKKLFMGLVPVSVWASREPRRAGLSHRMMRMFGSVTMFLLRAKPKSGLEEIGREWQRMFPSNDDVPITGVRNDTVYAEIHIHCPHRGTGNVQGCHRMMEYDRKMLEKIGGQLVVLRSQAEPGVEVCQLAIRKEGAATEDLVPATARARSG
jgi:hypothetical protein